MTLKCWTSAIGQSPAVSTGMADMQVTVGAGTAVAPPSILTTNATAVANGTEVRRRSVGFITTTSSGLVATTPTRGFGGRKSNRCRSLSSTWEATDSDEEDADATTGEREEKTDVTRREPVFTPLVSTPLHSNRADNVRSPGSNQHDGTANHTPRRRHHGSRSARSRRRRTMSESSGSSNSRRVLILTPVASKVCFGGWVRGQPAEVRWEVVDKSVQCVRIDVCNVAWSVPTTIATRVPNDGYFQWKRVYWGMPITDGYYVNIYDVTDVAPHLLEQQQLQKQGQSPRPIDRHTSQQQQENEKSTGALLARSDCFAVIG